MHSMRRLSRLIAPAAMPIFAVVACCASASCCHVGEWARFTVNAIKLWFEDPPAVWKVTVTGFAHRGKNPLLGSPCYTVRYSTGERKRTAIGLAVPRIQGCA